MHPLGHRGVGIQRALGLLLRQYLAISLRGALAHLLLGHQARHPLLPLDADDAGLRGADGCAACDRHQRKQRRDQAAAPADCKHGRSAVEGDHSGVVIDPGITGASTLTPAFCARCRNAWSISTSASIASAIGVARMPTQGSCRPWVSMVAGRPCKSMVRRGLRMLDVGLIAIDTVIGCTLEMPPSTPP